MSENEIELEAYKPDVPTDASSLFGILTGFSEDFFEDGREQPAMQERDHFQ